MRELRRLFQPASIAVLGGGAWCAQIIQQARAFGYCGEIYPVHPKAGDICGIPASRTLADLPVVPDAAFLGINRNATIEAARELAARGTGGAVCFASGFSEAQAEDDSGQSLQQQLLDAAGDMPILGPNCYGFINALDQTILWPDQHGCQPVDHGVAILTQSSNIAINLTMQTRGLPIAYMVTCGNMAQVSQAEIALSLLDDPRVTALGLHIEGFGDLGIWHAVAIKAKDRDIPLIALKVGKSDLAQQATISHTASLAGSDAGAQAVLDRFGIARVGDLPSFLETLKLLHCTGRLSSPYLSSISCSGGEASLIADTCHGRAVSFPPLGEDQLVRLRTALGPKVALANPLDYHTYIWRDTDAMTQSWAAMASPDIGLTMTIVDYPTTDAADWECATQAALNVRQLTGRPVAVVATLPELMPQDVAQRLMAGGVTPLNGLREAITAAEVAARPATPVPEPILAPGADRAVQMIAEAEAKRALSLHGLAVPKQAEAASPEEAERVAGQIGGVVALKGVGVAHKSEAGAVRLNLTVDQVAETAGAIPGSSYLIEEMISGGVAELLIGVIRDPAHGFVLTLAAGGVLTELWQDSTSLLIPINRDEASLALRRLKTYPLIAGYRGKPAASETAILDAVMAVQAYVLANADTLSEVEINPLICTPERAVAADALIRKAP